MVKIERYVETDVWTFGDEGVINDDTREQFARFKYWLETKSYVGDGYSWPSSKY